MGVIENAVNKVCDSTEGLVEHLRNREIEELFETISRVIDDIKRLKGETIKEVNVLSQPGGSAFFPKIEIEFNDGAKERFQYIKGSDIFDKRIGNMFHEMWGNASSGDKYDKKKWNDMQILLKERGIPL